MYREHSIDVVIPAYNEEGFIEDVIREMPAHVDAMYVVDDQPTDGSWDECLEAARDCGSLLTQRAEVYGSAGRVFPIQHHKNMDTGGAIKTGYLAALAGSAN